MWLIKPPSAELFVQSHSLSGDMVEDRMENRDALHASHFRNNSNIVCREEESNANNNCDIPVVAYLCAVRILPHS